MVQVLDYENVDPRYGYFFSLEFGTPDFLKRTQPIGKEGVIAQLEIEPRFQQQIAPVEADSSRDRPGLVAACRQDSKHHTGYRQADYLVLNARGYAEFPPFVTTTWAAIVSTKLASQLLTSGLWGFSIQPTRLDEDANDPDFPLKEPVHALIFEGEQDYVQRKLIPAEPNRCCFCGKGPVLCPECGEAYPTCKHCGDTWLVPAKLHQGAGDPRTLLLHRFGVNGLLDVSQWDGSDFLGYTAGGVATWRAVDFLVRVHAAPFVAVPIPYNARGLSPEQLARLEQARTPLPA